MIKPKPTSRRVDTFIEEIFIVLLAGLLADDDGNELVMDDCCQTDSSSLSSLNFANSGNLFDRSDDLYPLPFKKIWNLLNSWQ